jgi:glycosyltransferase involved in cell wall biosynthesis
VRILAAIPARADSSFAHAINTFKMADGFARLGHDVVLACLTPANPAFGIEELKAKLSLSPRVTLATIRGAPVRLLTKYYFASEVTRLATRTEPHLAYVRDRRLPARIARRHIPVAAETHGGPPFKRSLKNLFAASVDLVDLRTIVTLSPFLKAEYLKQGVPDEKLIVLPTGVDLELFRRPDGWQRPSRDRPQIVYSGHLYDYKGIPTVLGAARLLPDYDFTLVGGWPDDVARVTADIAALQLTNIVLAGNQPYPELPAFLWNAHVLLLPPSANHPSARWTSPVKLGEYLASGTPIVASAVPALRDLVTDEEVCFFRPDDAASLATGIRRVVTERGYAAGLAASGLTRANELGYVERARSILDRALKTSSAEISTETRMRSD